MNASTKWALGSFAVFSLTATVGASRQEIDLSTIMQRKLDHAHNVLEALITEDYEALRESGAALQTLSEEAGWFVLETAEYAQRSAEFRRAAEQIEEAAEERNIDGAALGYVQMTLECVKCHQMLRGTQRAELGDVPASFRAAAARIHPIIGRSLTDKEEETRDGQ